MFLIDITLLEYRTNWQWGVIKNLQWTLLAKGTKQTDTVNTADLAQTFVIYEYNYSDVHGAPKTIP